MQIVNEESDADIDVFGVWYINVRPKYETLNKLHKKRTRNKHLLKSTGFSNATNCFDSSPENFSQIYRS